MRDEVIKFIKEEFNKNNYFNIEYADKPNTIYLKWKTDNKIFAVIYEDKVIQIINSNKEEETNV
jgi:hypothetical protein